MHQVAFRKRALGRSSVVDVFIAARLLCDFVRDAEAESAAQEGHPDLAGKYEGLPWSVLATSLLLGEAAGIWAVLERNQGKHRAPLLICGCREPGCWPLMATIETTNDSVTWRDFRQPHRKDWDYSHLGPFSFDRAQYLTALEQARFGST